MKAIPGTTKQAFEAGMVIFQMLDELAYKLGYKNGAQDLAGEEPAVNVELMQIVQEELERAMKEHEEKKRKAKLREDQLRAEIRAQILAELAADPAYQ